MYATIHSAEITHRQHANDIARAAEFARIRAERPQDVIAPPRRIARLVKALRPSRARRARVAAAVAN